MANDSWLLREDGYINIDTPTSSIIYHPNLNVILVSSQLGQVHVLDVNSGGILQSSSLSGDASNPVNIQYLPGSDRIVFCDENGLGVRSDYNGVLLLHTALQQPLKSSKPDQIVKVELFLSEAVLLFQCLQSIELVSIECSGEVVKALGEAIEKANRQTVKGIKAQKWCTICLELPHLSLKLVASNIVSELKRHNRHVPALAIASALYQRIYDLMPTPPGGTKIDSSDRELMSSEAARRETFKKWPHMDYKWALPAQMAQAGFFHQPTSSGDDRATCFNCCVCLVCWEKTDEPWSEHERHSSKCALVKGEYTHNVPLSVTNATSPAYAYPGVSVISKGNSGDIFLTGTSKGCVSIWNVDCKLKMQQEFTITMDEPLLMNIFFGPYSLVRNAWDEDFDRDYRVNLSALAIVGRCQNKMQPCSKNIPLRKCRARPTIVCGVNIQNSRTISKTSLNIWSATKDSSVVKMNHQNQAKSCAASNSCYLLVYDFQGKCAHTVSPLTNGNGCVSLKSCSGKSGGSKKCGGVSNANCRSQETNVYDDIYLSKYMCLEDEPELSPEVAFVASISDQVLDIKNLVSATKAEVEKKFLQSESSNKNNSNSNGATTTISKSIEIVSNVKNPFGISHAMPLLGSTELLEASFTLEGNSNAKFHASDSILKKFSDEMDATLGKDQDYNIHNHLSAIYHHPDGLSDVMPDILYEYKDSGIKMKVPYSKPSTTKSANAKTVSNESTESEVVVSDDTPPPACTAVQCLTFPNTLSSRTDLVVTHVLPTNDGDHLLVVLLSNNNPNSSESQSLIMNGYHDDADIGSDDTINFDSNDVSESCVDNKPTSYLLLYSLTYESVATLINEVPLHVKELSYEESPLELCLLPNLDGDVPRIGLAATVGRDGALRLINIEDLSVLAETKVESVKFKSVAFCSSLEKLCVCTEKGAMYFYAIRDSEGDSTEECDEEDINSDHWLGQQASSQDPSQAVPNQVCLIAQKNSLGVEDLENLTQLAGISGKGDNVVAYSAVVPSCWCELLPAQRPRSDNQNVSRTWRLQNTASTWDEHVLELTLPWSLSIAQVELKFTLHSPCPITPNIQVTLLKQHLHGIGHRKESKHFPRVDDHINFNLIDSDQKGPVENPVLSAEYLRAHNAEILAGPLVLAQGLDLSSHSGTLTLTSPKLFKARGRTLLLHIKTLFDPSKEMYSGRISKKSKDNPDPMFTLPGSTVERFASPFTTKKVEFYIGCDWLHEISITVRSNKHTDIPHERLQRIAMLESNQFLENLLTIAAKNSDKYSQSMALDLLIWVVSIRLARFRNAKAESALESDEFNAMSDNNSTSTEKDKKQTFSVKSDVEPQQLECVKILQQNVQSLVKNCILLSKRSTAKKCIKLILICREGAKKMDEETSSHFEMAILKSVIFCLPLVGAANSAGSLRWFTQLTMRVVALDKEMKCANYCIHILKDIATIMKERINPYHLVLRSRFGLYGLPMESSIFDIEPPVLGKTSSISLTYASIVAGEAVNQTTNTPQEVDLRDLYNHTGKGSNAGWWWQESNGISGLSEVMALKVSCHSVSDGMMLESAPHNADTATPSNDHTQYFDTMGLKEFMDFVRNLEAAKSAKNAAAAASEMNQNDANTECFFMECESGWNQTEDSTKNQDNQSENDSPFRYKDGCKYNNITIPWQQLVQQPPQQTLVIKRMHSGSRHFVVLDFGYPVRLTDLVIPSCPELIMLSIHVWLHSEDQDSTKLVQVPDILAKDLIMIDIQPPPVCRYLKISTIGRYNISTTRCKIPLGWFYGEIVENGLVPETQLNTLQALHQDLTCRFRLAVGKLTDCLDPYLDCAGGNASHMTAYLDSNMDSRVRATYQECLELQHQINTVERTMEKFKTPSDSDDSIIEDIQKQPPLNLLKQSSTDKLKYIAEAFTDVLLFTCFDSESAYYKRPQVSVTMSWCDLMMKWLVVMGGNAGPRFQAALASVLTKLCCTKPWWGAFLADTVATLYTPQNTLIFPQDRVLILLTYMGRKSLWRGGVVECVSRLISELLPIPNSHPLSGSHNYSQSPVWQSTDLSLLSWLLIYLSSLLDTAQTRDTSKSWSRWDFLSGNNGSNSSNANGNGNNTNTGRAGGPASRFPRRKLHKRIFHHKLEELEAVRKAFQVQALSALSSQAANQEYAVEVNHINVPDKVFKSSQPLKQHWVKRFEDFIQDRISVLNKRVSGGTGRGSTPSASGSREDTPLGSETRLPRLIPQSLALQLSKRLIYLILSMDFTCNTDLLLLACKVVGRICSVCGGLPNMIQEHEVLGLLRAACSPYPWHQHAIQSLLQDLVDLDRSKWRAPSLPPSMLPLIQTETPDGTIQWHTAQNVPISFAHDLNNESAEGDTPTPPPQPLETTSSGSSELLPVFIESDDSDMENLLDEISEWCRPTGPRNNAKAARKPVPNTSNGASLAIDSRMESGIEVSAEVLIRKLSLLGGSALAYAVNTAPLQPLPSGVTNQQVTGQSSSAASQPSTSQASPTPPPTPAFVPITTSPVQTIPEPSTTNASTASVNSANTNPTPSTSSSMPTSTSSSDASNSPPPRELISMLKRSIHVLFMDLEGQDDSAHLERALQLWVTLNGCSWGVTNNKPRTGTLVPKIKLSKCAVETLIHALHQQTNISLRCWLLGFQCLLWIANSTTVSNDGKTPLDMASVILDDEQFPDMVIKFLSSSLFNDYTCNGAEKQCVGPVVCATFSSLLARVVDVSTSKGRTTILYWMKTLTGPSGAIRTATGPLDAQKELLKSIVESIEYFYPYINEHMTEAISIVENATFIAQSVCCTTGLESFGMLDSSSGMVTSDSSSGGVGGFIVKALARFSKPPDRKELVVATINFASGLIAMPIKTDVPQESDQETMEQSIEESQTDESKASQQTSEGPNNTSSSAGSSQPCLADKVLQLCPTMKRVLKTLSICSTPNFSVISMGLQSDNCESITVGDALFKFALILTDAASHPSLVLGHILEFVANDNGNLSEALVCLFLRHLVNESALQCWVSMGGCEALSRRLVSSYRLAPGPRSSLVASLHTHLKSGPGQTAQSNSTDKNLVETTQGLTNYAPYSSIICGNPSAQVADVLLGATNSGAGGASGGAGGTVGCAMAAGSGGGNATHRRARSAAWNHHFCNDEGFVDLAVKLPHAILLHEVQLQPHLTTLSSCPSAVSLEVSSHGYVMATLGPPQPTAGMTFIRLKLMEPQVVTSLMIRLYRPRDSRNMGLLFIKVLGTPAFAIPSNEKLDEKIAATCVGWARLLVACFRGNREARQRCVNTELAEAAAGLLLGGAAPPLITGSLLRALGSEPQGAITVLDLILWNAHVPNHHVYQYSSQNLINKNSAVESACDLLYHLCTLQDDYTPHRIKRFIHWLKDCGINAISQAEKRNSDGNTSASSTVYTYNSKHLSGVYVQCLSSVLWSAKEYSSQYDLESLITVELFDIIYKWIAILPKDSATKKALDAVMCSICYIRPELFTMMLQKMGVLTLDTRLSSSSSVNVEASISDDSKDSSDMTAMTDDTKVYCVPSHQSLKPAPLESLMLSPAQLMTIASAAMSPDAIKMLMKSRLPHNVAEAIKQFCLLQCQQEKSYSCSSMTDSDKANTREQFSRHYHSESGLINLEMMPVLIDWLSNLCIDNELKTWLGEFEGSCFWTPLLLMLCLPQPHMKIWQKNEFYMQLEERTIRFLGAVMTCHPVNQQLFATTLYNIISSHPDISPGVGTPIGGFTRGLLLRLVLRGERVTVGIRGPSGKPPPISKTPTTPSPPSLPAHPSLRGRTLLTMPLHSKLCDIISQITFGGNVWANGDSNLGKKLNTMYKGTSAESTGQDVDPWGLTVAAANTAKDKRSKDLRNLCAKTGILGKKKSSLGTPKKEEQPSGSTSNASSSQDSWSLNIVKVYVDGLDGPISPSATLGVVSTVTEHKFGPSINLTLIPQPHNDGWSENSLEGLSPRPSLLGVFASAGGLALLARHLPPTTPAPVPVPSSVQQTHTTSNNADTDWVKLDDIYEDVGETSANTNSEETTNSVPTHSLIALGLLLRLPGYAEALLKEGQRAVFLLRLLLGVTDDGEGKDILSVCGPGLGTLAFRVLVALLDSSPLHTDDGRLLRNTLLRSGSLRLLLACLAVFTHQQPDSPPQESSNANGSTSKSKGEEKSKLYWAKGTGFGTGSTQQSWNVEQSLMRQKTEEEHVTVLLQVIASFIQPGEQWSRRESVSSESGSSSGRSSPIQDVEQPPPSPVPTTSTSSQTSPLPSEVTYMLQRSALLPAISSYLRNDSVLDMSRHIPLYLAVMRVVRAIMSSGALWDSSNNPSGTTCITQLPPALQAIPPLLHQMSRTVDTYATKLKMNKKVIYGKTSFSQRFTSGNTINTTNDGGEDDEGLAMLIPDIQATSALVQARLGLNEEGTSLTLPIPRTPSAATREARYLEVMKRLQFETFEMITECSENGYKFTVPYHFESSVRAAGERCHPARMKRLAQEAVTLSTSLPLSYSSSVFVRTDQDRLDVMKVLITGPSDTPYANGCFELDVYFPVDYPNTPMLINLETTGRHSVRFNPNLYLDGKVCLSVLNTWHGRPEEQWNAQTSSFLQVLVSIQSLILVPEPYFNEPGFERSRGTPGGTHHSLEYNSNIYQACVRWAMLEQLRNPTSCFKQVIQTHFWLKRDEICSVIEGWISELEMHSGDKRAHRNICVNAIALKRHYQSLREELAKLPCPPGLEELDTPFDVVAETPSVVPSAPPSSSAAPPTATTPPQVTENEPDLDMESIIKKILSLKE